VSDLFIRDDETFDLYEEHRVATVAEIAAILDLVDLRLIADRLVVPVDTVNKWRHRGVLPDPDYPQLRNPTWNWETIRQWAEETGRMK
jgi:hypothetical protein